MHFSSTYFLNCTQLTHLDQILPISLCYHTHCLENEGKNNPKSFPQLQKHRSRDDLTLWYS